MAKDVELMCVLTVLFSILKLFNKMRHMKTHRCEMKSENLMELRRLSSVRLILSFRLGKKSNYPER